LQKIYHDFFMNFLLRLWYGKQKPL
jgi:hypothetical protein